MMSFVIFLGPCYSRASLVAQLLKNLPAVQETQVQSLGWEDSLEKGMSTHPSILAWRTSLQPMECPWNSPGKNSGVGSYSLLQGIFPTQGLNLDLLHCRRILYCLSHKGSPISQILCK